MRRILKIANNMRARPWVGIVLGCAVGVTAALLFVSFPLTLLAVFVVLMCGGASFAFFYA